MGTLVLIAYCSCHRGHSFQDSVQNENMGPLVKKCQDVTNLPLNQRQDPSKCGALHNDGTGHAGWHLGPACHQEAL